MQTVFNRKLLSLAVCGVMTAAVQPALSQEEPVLMEEIVVRGMRSSVQTAQDIKRDADTVMDAISATDIGALPDKSVTEALQRVPGVTIERFAASDDPNHYADEGTGVLVRGLDRVRSEINGRDSFSANPNGGLNFEDISPELLGSVEVIKNQTADMVSGGIAGTVNLVTRKPFDTDGRMIGGTLKGNYGDFREEWSPSVSGLFSDVWETDVGDFGFLISASHSDLRTRGDGIGVANFYSRSDEHIHVGAAWDPNAIAGTAPESPVEGPAVFTGQPSGVRYYTPGQYSLRTAENDRERSGFATSFQWRSPDDSIETTLEYVRSDASLEWRENVIGPQAQGFAWEQWTNSSVLTADEAPEGMGPTWDDNNMFTSGVLRFGAEMPMHLSTRYNETETTVEDLSFNVSWQATDRLTVDFDVQRVESTETMANNGINARAQPSVSDVYLDLRGSTPYIEFLNDRLFEPDYTPNWDGPRPDVFLGTALDTAIDSDASMDAVKLDFSYDLEGNWARSLKFGVYHSEKDLTVRDTEYSNWGAVNTPWSTELSINGDYNAIPDEFERQSWDDFYQSKGALGGRDDFLFINMSAAENFADFMRRACDEGFNTAPYGETNPGGASDVGQSNPNCYQAMEDMGGRVAPGSPFAPHDITSTNEQRAEAYVRFDFGDDTLSMPYRGNIGLRYVNYQLESTGYTVMPNVGGDVAEFLSQDLVDFADGLGEVTTVDGTDYSTVLPSLNLALNVTDDVIVRFGASKSLYYPNLRDTRNSRIVNLNYSIIEDDDTGDRELVPGSLGINGTARNPFLEPEEAINLDLSTEWYFSDAGSLSLALFYKDIDNLFRERPFIAEVTNPRSNVTQEVSFNGPANDGSGSIRGFEVSYNQFFDMLPGAWSGLGVQLNYTYIDQNDLNDPMSDDQFGSVRFDTNGDPINDNRNSFRAFTDLPLPGYSDENYNVVGMYEYGRISARLAYTWRSDYLVTRRDSNEFAPVYAKANGFMDGSIYFNITDNVKVGFEASNILNSTTETQVQFDQAGTRTDALNFRTDRRYALSLRASF
ncbi:TonB-dependent receptor [Marinimicrobium sp. ARAG 43.8]|uniref:TonB-dependent receptor n=1 Tax=Marinimicrobium sp. ARAG 43.8 TaxID=3418719 RepID=UPI003CEDF50F